MAQAALRSIPPDGRVIMISGASRGIGLAIAKRLLADGYRLSLGVRRPGEVKGFDPERVLVHPFEAARAQTAEPWLAATLERFGRLDALVNNAGIVDVKARVDAIWAKLAR